MRPIDKSLLEQMHISEVEIQRRKEFLSLDEAGLADLAALKPIINEHIEIIVEEFYERQTEIDEISLLIGDSETLQRLRSAQRQYVLDLFTGYYDAEYVNSRLRIGLVHKRIGVEPKLFLAAMRTLKEILFRVIDENLTDQHSLTSAKDNLDKLMYFDITLVFDTYIDTLLNEVHSAKRRMEIYARNLEEKTKELATYAEKDALTGLFNQRGMSEALSREIRMAERRHSLVSLIYCDIDDFKQINDTYGHHKGDEILITFGQIMRETVRSSDICCRLGGDEFCCILPDCDVKSAGTIGSKIELAFQDKYPDFSISLGVAETGDREYLREEELLRAADAMMYRNKEARKRGRSNKAAKPSPTDDAQETDKQAAAPHQPTTAHNDER
ncbi:MULTISPECIES: GGDEF domain-containing protein [unclassified Halomonas]|uniref:GGDEF domain-containing protein n=1 Tax=unclassified Halomonas TaxID=2609666 RepID=UPI001C9445D6|nr:MULTISPECIES: GGDEF domain-containing protein [unclassified Halomonas]MBY5923834.1 GGDEF domain-containing protein [Halomonas sp. DP4Y7-2]MBY6230876.1 GGDEF domain-containing protein [Halomonas sp. DP4Y7-1]